MTVVGFPARATTSSMLMPLSILSKFSWVILLVGLGGGFLSGGGFLPGGGFWATSLGYWLWKFSEFVFF